SVLQDERRVDEGLVVHPQHLLDPFLRAANAAFGQRLGVALRVKLAELQVRLPGLAASTLPDHLVAAALEVELELHPHFCLVEADQVVRRVAARLPPQRPGHCVQQGGLSVAVVAGETGDVEPGEIDRLDLFSVAQEIAQRQANRNHTLLRAFGVRPLALGLSSGPERRWQNAAYSTSRPAYSSSSASRSCRSGCARRYMRSASRGVICGEISSPRVPGPSCGSSRRMPATKCAACSACRRSASGTFGSPRRSV